MYGMPCLSSRCIPLASAKVGGSVGNNFRDMYYLSLQTLHQYVFYNTFKVSYKNIKITTLELKNDFSIHFSNRKL